MKKKIVTIVLTAAMLSLTGCSNKALETANTAVEEYNAQVESYNNMIAPYNEAVGEIEEKNGELQDALDEAQEVINQGEEPFEEETLTNLKDVMSEASDAKVEVPEELAQYEELTVDGEAKKDELESLTEQAKTDTAALKAFTLPDIPSVPDYTSELDNLAEAQLLYEDSITGLKQVTAPSDDFVMERLQTVDTITEMDAVTEDHDPNGQLNKQGGYTGCIYFRDTQVNWSTLYIESGKDNVIDVGCDGGGAIEIYKTVKEAEARDTYLASFDGTAFTSGSHYVYGTIIVRTSDELSGTKQVELTDKIVEALTKVEH